jgi:hypothetical protein
VNKTFFSYLAGIDDDMVMLSSYDCSIHYKWKWAPTAIAASYFSIISTYLPRVSTFQPIAKSEFWDSNSEFYTLSLV